MKKDSILEKQNNFNALVAQIDTIHKTLQSKSIQWEQGIRPVGRVALIPTYGCLSLSARFYFIPTLFKGALENSTLQETK